MENDAENKLPHDSFFKFGFGISQIVEQYITKFLPDEIAKDIDISTLTLDNNTYITEELSYYFSDVVWKCNLKSQHQIRLALLFEHKSNTSKYPHLQLLRYILNIWEQNIKNKEPLMLVIPIIIYQGKRKWKHTSMNDYFHELPEYLTKYVPLFEYELTELQKFSDEDYVKMEMGMLYNIFVAMRYIKDKEFILNNSRKIFLIKSNRMLEDYENNIVKEIVVYLSRSNQFSPSELYQILKKLSRPIKTTAMTTYDQLINLGKKQGIEQGIEKGIEKGIEQTIFQAAKNMIEKGLPEELICEILDVTKEFVNTVRNALT